MILGFNELKFNLKHHTRIKTELKLVDLYLNEILQLLFFPSEISYVSFLHRHGSSKKNSVDYLNNCERVEKNRVYNGKCIKIFSR